MQLNICEVRMKYFLLFVEDPCTHNVENSNKLINIIQVMKKLSFIEMFHFLPFTELS